MYAQGMRGSRRSSGTSRFHKQQEQEGVNHEHNEAPANGSA